MWYKIIIVNKVELFVISYLEILRNFWERFIREKLKLEFVE